MQKRKLGNIEVPALAFGTNILGWTVDEKQSFTLLDHVTEQGFNFIDTADIYSNWAPGHTGGESETIIGKWLKSKGNRAKMIIASKVGMQISADKKGLSANYIVQAVEASLKRLQTDYIDLYQAHKDDEATPIEESLAAFDRLIQQGKVRQIGASNFSAERLQQSLDISKKNKLSAYVSLQPHYNLFERKNYETELEKTCHQNGIAVIPYFALASGFLTGKYRTAADFSKSVRGSSMNKFFTERGFKILSTLDRVSKKHNANPTQVALAWLMARPGITAPIASATTVEQIDDLVKSTRLKLETTDLDLLNRASVS